MPRRLTSFILILLVSGQIVAAQTWRSSLYPADWQPGYADTGGRQLQDYSYAGYHRGEKKIPTISGKILDVTQAPYHADNSGKADSRAAIQRAISDAEKSPDGAVVFLPPGEYTVAVPDDKNYGLLISGNNVVLRGAGADKTFIKSTTTKLRQKSVILVTGTQSSWHHPLGKAVPLTANLSIHDNKIPVADTTGFKVGDLVVIATDLTDDFIKTYGLTNYWSSTMRGLRFCRFITNIDTANNALGIDIPIRYPALLRDHARIYKIGPQVREAGLENFSIGNLEHAAMPDQSGENDFSDETHPAWQVHASHLITFRNAMNCWARGLATYRPAENRRDYHVLSNALLIIDSRNVTVENCILQKPQYLGGGGNGYMFTLMASDNLLKDCTAIKSRHNFSFKGMQAHGNVILHCTGIDGTLPSDFHMHLSTANLIDNFTANGDCFMASFRPWGNANGGLHGHPCSENVFWNTKGQRAQARRNYLIDSRQWGHGYVIGTSGSMQRVNTQPVAGEQKGIAYDSAPEDFVEGSGKGESLQPGSLYLDQLAKRLATASGF